MAMLTPRQAKMQRLERELKPYWRVTPEWAMQTSYIIAGGTSVLGQDLAPLVGRNVVAVNSSYEAAPWAPVLFFGDLRWWRKHAKALERFKGRIVTTTLRADEDNPNSRLLRLKRIEPPPGISLKTHEAVMSRTSLQAAINLVYHLGSRRMVLLGADNRSGPDGRDHHHSPHPWPRKENTWDVKVPQLKLAAEDLARLGVEVLNASPISTLDFWPKVKLEDTL